MLYYREAFDVIACSCLQSAILPYGEPNVNPYTLPLLRRCWGGLEEIGHLP